jgi:putrescine aminotransferase
MTMTGPSDAVGLGVSQAFQLARQHLPPGLALLQKIAGGGEVESSAEGAEVRLSDGRVVLDLGSYAVTLLGHRHPDVVAALDHQLGLLPTSTRTLCNPTTVRLAARLVAALEPGRLTRVWFGLNGSDVVDLALRLARTTTGRNRVLAVRRGFHGKGLGALAVTWSARYRRGAEGILPLVTHLRPDDAGAVSHAVTAGDVAAMIVEPIQGEGGVWPLDPAILARWAADARAAGVFVIADEIQTGLGRCGPIAVSVESGLQPDAVLLGKALGGGVLPLSAMVATDALYAPLLDDPFLHTATFGGHPLCCAAGIAALDAVLALAARGQKIGVRFGQELEGLRRRYPALIVDVRGRGLMWGVELAPHMAGTVLLEIARNGLLFAPCLDQPEVLRLLPPLVINDRQIDRALEILDRSLAVSARSGRPEQRDVSCPS